MRSKARNIGYILDSKDLSKNSRHKKLYGPNELMEQPNIKLVGEKIELQIFMTLKRKFEFSAYHKNYPLATQILGSRTTQNDLSTLVGRFVICISTFF